MLKNSFCLLNLLLVFSILCLPVVAEEKTDEEKTEEKKRKQEALEKRLAEEKAIKSEFSYSFNDITDHIVIVSCSSTKGRWSGSGFVAIMEGKSYLFTNQHVILGADKISFKTASGLTLKPRGVHLSTTRDIARLPLDDISGFAITGNLAIDTPIGVFGNSEGGGVATELYGKIVSVGADKITVSADFVPGNSGSPVLNLNREVIGIATGGKYDTDDDNDITVSRYCYRLTGNKWKPVNWKKYNDKYGKLYRNNEALVESTIKVVYQWYGSSFNSVKTDEHPDPALRRWSTAHNHMINRINRQREKGKATRHELNNINKQISQDLVDSAEALSKVCRNRSRQMRFLSEQRELTGFLRKNYESLTEQLEEVAKDVDRKGKKLVDYKFFHFRNDRRY